MYRLKELQIRNLKATDKDIRLSDSEGLYLLIRKSGIRSFQYRYTSPITKKEKIYTIGQYPQLSLSQARTEHGILKASVSSGICIQNEKIQSRKAKPIVKDSFKDIAVLWNETRKTRVGKTTWDKDISRVERFIYPKFADKPLDEIQASDLLNQLKTVAETTGRETAMRTMNHVSSILKYAMALGKIKYNVASGLTEYLPKPEVINRKAILDEDLLGKFIYTSENHDSSHSLVGCALRLMPHIFVRHGEMLGMKWRDINFKDRVWKYEVGKTKNKKGGVKEHTVFLSEQVIKILEDIKKITHDKENVFHSSSSQSKEISQTAVNNLVRALGFDRNTVHIHGFRATARTMGEDKLMTDSRVIEMCLAHATSEKLGTAYDRAQRLNDRQKFMNDWSDYLINCKKKYQKTTIKLAK